MGAGTKKTSLIIWPKKIWTMKIRRLNPKFALNLLPVRRTTMESVRAHENSENSSMVDRLQNSWTLAKSTSARFLAIKASILESTSSSVAVIWTRLGSIWNSNYKKSLVMEEVRFYLFCWPAMTLWDIPIWQTHNIPWEELPAWLQEERSTDIRHLLSTPCRPRKPLFSR